jgi:ammonium transporter, Amt family
VAIFFVVLAITFLLLTARRLSRKKLSRSHTSPGKVRQVINRLRTPEWRRYGILLLAGKLAGIALLVFAAYLSNPGLLGFRVFAADPTLKGNDIVSPINTLWTLVAAFLVFGMQVGFTMLEAGFCS